MFRQVASERSDRQNRMLAGYLAFVGGFVNAAGFLVLGEFTSHVTGNVGRVASGVALGEIHAANAALAMVVAFFVGAFLTSVLVESAALGHPARAYAAALAIEATLLFGASEVPALIHEAKAIATTETVLLCMAMGLQNSLVTRLSGAVVRTTHLTGVVTDLGIEAARWFRFWRATTATRLRIALVVGNNAAERPSLPKALLLATIAAAFVLGAMSGALVGVRYGRAAMRPVAFAVLGFACYALYNGRRTPDDPRASRR